MQGLVSGSRRVRSPVHIVRFRPLAAARSTVDGTAVALKAELEAG